MLDFQTVTLSDRGRLDAILHDLPDPGCECTFANLYLWGPQKAAVEDGFVYILTKHAGADSYFLPAGQGDLRAAVKRLAQDAKKRGIPLSMYAVTDRTRALLEAAFPDTFCFYEVRSGFDYIYDIDRLAELKGKKLQAKRNHIHRFENACPEARVLTVDAGLLPRCREMVEKWYQKHAEQFCGDSFSAEKRALARLFANWDALGFEGLAVEAGGELIALTMGNRIREDVFDVNFEKAFTDVPGAYAFINRTFAAYLRDKYPDLKYLNREDDMGVEGLRKAKLSYYPDQLLKKYAAVAAPEAILG